MESFHRIHVAVSDSRGRRVAGTGRPDRLTFYRSAAKPFQALPLREDGAAERFGIGPEGLAICCASHNSEPEHLERARSVLEKAGRTPDDLECGPHPPLRREVGERLLREGIEPTALHNNCSGKHAGMLALAVARGWSPRGYVRAAHPVQRRMLEEVARWCRMPVSEVRTGTDGCGVVSFAVPLLAMAASFARLAVAASEGEEGPAAIVDAMTAHPFLVAGTGRLDTVMMEAAGDRIIVKTGAEGVYGAGLLDRGLGIALKVEDGGRRAADPALVRTLEWLDVLTADEVEELASFRRPVIRNTRGQAVGSIDADFDLSLAG